jgi:osmotically-inducible protein OsmY
MRLTLKGRVILALVFLLLIGGVGIYLYSKFTGRTLDQIRHQLMASFTQEATPAAPGSADTDIKARLLEAFFNQPELRKQNIAVAVSDGVVTFSGEVDAPRHKAALQQLGQQIAGVKQVIDHISVKAPSSADGTHPAAEPDANQQLAKKVEFALYKTDAFELKTMTVAAQDGRVRLSGSVRNVAEKLLAGRVAREVEGVTEVMNELTIQSPG